MPDEIEDAIGASAVAPKRMKGDEGEVEEHPLKDVIAADQYLASKAASASKRLGVRFFKIVPPGTV